jgi:peptide deformylase
MSLLRIYHYPDPVLQRPCEPIDTIDTGVRYLARDMAETMYAAPGVGLAAPQVGVSRRLIVLDCARKDEPPALITAINPEIVARDGACCEEEGCLSIPGYYTSVNRAARVTVTFLDLDGKPQRLDAEGLLAIAFQHEIDHLDGVLFVDRLSPLKKGIFRRKFKKMQAQQEEQM